MVRFQCDTCGRLRGENETWILGFAAENIGVTSARREISIADKWERARAVELFAVHFCSGQCRAEYTNVLFSDNPATRLGQPTVTSRRFQRVVPGGTVETMVSESKKPVVARRTVRRKKSA